MVEPFMQVVVDCLRATHHSQMFCDAVARELKTIGAARPDLRIRYRRATVARDVGEIERLLTICQRLLNGHEDISIDNLRVIAPTGRFHVGHGNRSERIFPES